MPPLMDEDGITLAEDAGVLTLTMGRGENVSWCPVGWLDTGTPPASALRTATAHCHCALTFVHCLPQRINPDMVALLDRALALAEAAEGPKALVVASSDGKFFCNGLDIEWMGANGALVMGMLESFWAWLAKLLVLGCPTVAAINGHAFGAGAFMLLSCDYRIMRTERGFINFPEAALGTRAQPIDSAIRPPRLLYP